MGTIKHYLSMGHRRVYIGCVKVVAFAALETLTSEIVTHRIQILKYEPSSDAIEVVFYNRKIDQHVYNYRFLLFSNATQVRPNPTSATSVDHLALLTNVSHQQYKRSIQTFNKYSEPYKWNRVDNLICGEEDRTMDLDSRFRRIMFGLIPGAFKDTNEEQEYIAKFKRLVEYLGKLRDKEESQSSLDIKIISSTDEKEDIGGEILKTRRSTSDAMVRFTVQLRKGKKREPFEWTEIAIDSKFDTTSSYRIMFNWLVASSTKVEAQVQLLHRRCTQFGLQLISFPQTTISKNLFLHAVSLLLCCCLMKNEFLNSLDLSRNFKFAVPTLLCLRDKDKAELLDESLKSLDFVEDGIYMTDSQVLECIDDSEGYDFPKSRFNGKVKNIPARQFVHRSGALFFRVIRDQQGWAILAGIENYRHASKENRFRDIAKQMVHSVAKMVATIPAMR